MGNPTGKYWHSIASSSDGTHLAAVEAPFMSNGDIWTSSNSGVTWTDQISAGSRNWHSIASSSDGSHLAAVVTNGGDIWTAAPSTTTPSAPTINSVTGGAKQLVVAFTPGADGGAAITGYKYSVNGGAYISAGTTTSPFTISGLADGTSYAVTLLATNSQGDGAASSAITGSTTPAPTPVPDPVQQSKITALSVSTAIAGSSTPVVISGSFVESIRSIHINGVALASGSWTQTPTTVSFTMPGKSTGTYQIQFFNGSAPVLAVQTFTFTSPSVVVAPTPAPTTKPKVIYIRCVKPGKGTRIAYGVNPVCPVGYVKK
jgi:hypothetical protein